MSSNENICPNQENNIKSFLKYCNSDKKCYSNKVSIHFNQPLKEGFDFSLTYEEAQKNNPIFSKKVNVAMIIPKSNTNLKPKKSLPHLENEIEMQKIKKLKYQEQPFDKGIIKFNDFSSGAGEEFVVYDDSLGGKCNINKNLLIESYLYEEYDTDDEKIDLSRKCIFKNLGMTINDLENHNDKKDENC